MSYKFILACFLITAGQVVSWYGTYSPFIWKWARVNMHFLPLIFSIPTGYLFLYGMRFAIEEMGDTWGPRLLGFGLSYLVFPLLVYYYFGESFTNPKTLICILLSFVIVAIQVFYK